MLGQLREHEDSIVGLDPRHIAPITGNYMSQSANTGPNVIIGKTMLMHRKFHRRAKELRGGAAGESLTARAKQLRDATYKGNVCGRAWQILLEPSTSEDAV
jgi:hypothetical protein